MRTIRKYLRQHGPADAIAISECTGLVPVEPFEYFSEKPQNIQIVCETPAISSTEKSRNWLKTIILEGRRIGGVTGLTLQIPMGDRLLYR